MAGSEQKPNWRRPPRGDDGHAQRVPPADLGDRVDRLDRRAEHGHGAARAGHVGHVEREGARARLEPPAEALELGRDATRGRASARRASPRRGRPCAPTVAARTASSRATGSGSSERQLEREERVAVPASSLGVVQAHRDLHAHVPERVRGGASIHLRRPPATAVRTASLSVAPASRLAASCSSRSGARAKATSRAAPIFPSNGERSGPSATSCRRKAARRTSPARRGRGARDARRRERRAPRPRGPSRRSASPRCRRPARGGCARRARRRPRAARRRCATAAGTGRGARRTAARPPCAAQSSSQGSAPVSTTWASMSKRSSSTQTGASGGPPSRRRSAGSASSRLRDRLAQVVQGSGPGRPAARPCTCARRPTAVSSSRIARSSAVSARPSTGQLSCA